MWEVRSRQTPHCAGRLWLERCKTGSWFFTMQIDNPDLWWPVNQGPQTLHDLLIEVDERQINRRVGLRRLDLVSEPDEVGRSFMFVVNGPAGLCDGCKLDS